LFIAIQVQATVFLESGCSAQFFYLFICADFPRRVFIFCLKKNPWFCLVFSLFTTDKKIKAREDKVISYQYFVFLRLFERAGILFG
jgi:hypothetical protein